MDPRPEMSQTRHRRAIATLVLVALAVIAVDQASKAWAVAVLEPRIDAGEGTIPVLGELLGLTYYENPGASFGIGSGFTWVFSAIAVAVAIVIARIARRLASLPWAIALGALLGGAIGNLIDRLFREPSFGMGHVVDFLAFGDWFVNNLADIAITVAAVTMMVLAFAGFDVDGTRPGHDSDPEIDHVVDPGADRARVDD